MKEVFLDAQFSLMYVRTKTYCHTTTFIHWKKLFPCFQQTKDCYFMQLTHGIFRLLCISCGCLFFRREEMRHNIFFMFFYRIYFSKMMTYFCYYNSLPVFFEEKMLLGWLKIMEQTSIHIDKYLISA